MTQDKPLLLVRFSNQSNLPRLPRTLLSELLDSAYRDKRKKPAALDLAALDDAGIALLNRRHLGRDRATDVLAFDDGEQEQDGRIRLGDVAVSAETARREAEARGVKFKNELAFYALHGLFHLLGMDDGDEDERRAMHEAQVKAMRKFGLEVEDAIIE